MKSYMTKLMGGAVLASGMLAAGCHHGDGYSGHGDPCWPDRYANESRAAVVANFQPQVENGHILDQTIWNIHFEYGTDKLTGGGLDKLDQLARRRPHPDPRVFLQTSRDAALDAKRITAIQKYLATTGSGTPYEVQVHDPAPPGIESVWPGRVPAKAAPVVQAGAPVTVNQGSNAGANQGVVNQR